MSNALFPTFKGLQWDVVKMPTWSTIIQRSASGRELRAALFSFPLWEFHLSFSWLPDRGAGVTDLKNLMGFFNQRNGSFDTFLYKDPTDNNISAQALGAGDGSTTQFQLVRTYGGFAEPIYNPELSSPAPQIFLNGVLQSSGYSINSTGLITFTSAQGNGVAVTGTFTFYYRVRFKDDTAEFNNFMYQLWELKQLHFVSVKQP